jgi:hypothetical protein
MRKALKEGRNVSVKGSSAATRLYRKNAEHGLQIPESIQALMSTSEDHPDDQFDHEFGDTSTPHYTYFQQDAEPIIITPSGFVSERFLYHDHLWLIRVPTAVLLSLRIRQQARSS